MAGTKEGAKKAVAKNLQNNPNFYSDIGRKGGLVSCKKGFGFNPELARIAGQKGGRKSKRGPAKKPGETDYVYQIRKGYKGWTVADGLALAESENGQL